MLFLKYKKFYDSHICYNDMGNHIHCMYIMHVISMNVHYTTHNMLCMQHSAICFCGNIEHTTNQAASRPLHINGH